MSFLFLFFIRLFSWLDTLLVVIFTQPFPWICRSVSRSLLSPWYSCRGSKWIYFKCTASVLEVLAFGICSVLAYINASKAAIINNGTIRLSVAAFTLTLPR